MSTTECPHCKTSYPNVLKTCPACGKTAKGSAGTSPVDIKKLIPFIVIMDLVIFGVILYLFVLKK